MTEAKMKNVLVSCDCIEQINAKLASHNHRLDIGLAMPATHRVGSKIEAIGRVLLRTVKLDPSKRSTGAPTVAATFCPWCGVRAAP